MKKYLLPNQGDISIYIINIIIIYKLDKGSINCFFFYAK